MALPAIGLKATLLIREYQKNVRLYERALSSMQQKTTKTANAVTSGAKEMERAFINVAGGLRIWESDLARYQERVVELMQSGGKGIETAQDAYVRAAQEITASYKKTEEAAKGAAGETSGFLTILKGAGITLQGIGIALSVVTTGFVLVSRAVRQAIADFDEAAQEIRILRLELGATTEEASAWVLAAEFSSVSVSTLTRAVGMLQKRIVDLRLRQIEGKEESTAFSRAINAVGISMLYADGTVKDTNTLLEEIRDRFQDLGPGIITTGLAMDIFGRSARNILPWLLESTETTEELAEMAARLGTTLDDTDPAYVAWKKSTKEVELAKEGLSNVIARFFIPAQNEANKLITDTIVLLRLYTAMTMGAVSALGEYLLTFDKTKAMDAFVKTTIEMTGAITDVKRAEQELAQARDGAAQETVLLTAAEQALVDRRKETLQQLAELPSLYEEKMLAIQERFDQRWEDLEIRRGRQQIERGIRLGWQLEDLWKRHQEKLADIASKRGDRMKQIEEQQAKKIADYNRDAQSRREKLEERHQERLYKIRTRYLDTVEEAVRRNDAVAVVRAVRQRQRSLRDAVHTREIEQRDLGKDLEEKRRKLADDYQVRKAEEQKQRQDEVERANVQYARQLENLRIAKERERFMRQMQQKWEEEDLERAKERQIQTLERWYAQEKAKLEQQLTELKQIGVQKTKEMMDAMTMTIINGMRAFREAEAALASRARTSWGQSQHPGYRAFREAETALRRQHGGIDVVNRPTHYIAGEGGAEIAAFIPLRQSMNLNVGGRMGVDFQGLPGGTNTNQAEQIVYSVMTQVAERLLAGMGR